MQDQLAEVWPLLGLYWSVVTTTCLNSLWGVQPVQLNDKTWQATRREIFHVLHHALGGGAVARLHYLKIALPAVNRHEVGHQLTCHRERRAIDIAFLLFLVG